MRSCLLFISLCVSTLLTAQDISFQYINQQGVTTTLAITKETKQIVIEDQPSLTKFNIRINNLPASHKVIPVDPDGVELGTYSTSGAVQPFTAGTVLNDKQLTLIYVDDKNIRTEYAKVAMLNKLPLSQLDVTSPLTAWMAGTKKVCAPLRISGKCFRI